MSIYEDISDLRVKQLDMEQIAKADDFLDSNIELPDDHGDKKRKQSIRGVRALNDTEVDKNTGESI